MNTPVQETPSQFNQPPLATQPVPGQQSPPQASIETPPGSRSKLSLIVFFIIVSLVAGGFFGYLSLQEPATQDTTPTKTLSPQPTQEPIPQYGQEQTIMLRDVSGGTGSGQATRTYIPGKPAIMKYSISTNLPDPAVDAGFYQVWLVEDVNDLATWFPLSILWKDGNGYSMEDEYNLPSEPPPLTSYYAYNTMVITLETGDSARVTADDGVVGPKVLEGSFTR